MIRNRRHPELVPAPQVPDKQITAATSVLTAQELSIYQQLYKIGLTSPGGGGPLAVKRSIEHLACIRVFPFPEHQEWGFLVTPADDPASVVPKAEALFSAINEKRSLVHSLACCPLAEVADCVCTASFKCAVHGSHCHGSHD